SAQADLFQTASLTDMHTPSGTPGQGRGYGLGLIVNHFGGPTTDYEWGHNGAMDGTISFLIHRDDGMAFAVTCNTRPAGDGYCGQLRSLIDGLVTTLNAANAWPDYDLFPCTVPAGDAVVGLEAPRILYVNGTANCAVRNGLPT